jgi:uncharacterized membrane protein YkoI
MPRALAILLSLTLLFASGVGLHADDLDQNEARRAVERGELRPLAEILAAIQKEFGGKVLDVELEREDSGALVYEIELLGTDGRVLELEYDGRTGRRISLEREDD